MSSDLNPAATPSKKAKEEDGFLTSLAALRQVLQLDSPTRSLLEKPLPLPQVQYYQKEKLHLLRELEVAKTESKAATRALEEAAKVNAAKHAEEIKALQEQLESVQQESRERIRALESQLADRQNEVEKLMKEMETAADCAEEERSVLEESMVRLEGINQSLLERCDNAEAAKTKLQAELNLRTEADEQSKEALIKITRHLVNVESSAAEANEWKQKMNDALTSVTDLKYKLQQTERELAETKSKVISMELETERQTVEWESKLKMQQVEQDATEKLASLEQELRDNQKESSGLRERLESETAELQSKLAAKEALLEAKDEMLKLMTAKIESLQKKETALRQEVKDAQSAATAAAEIHTAEIQSIKGEMEDMKDELECAEDEVVRCRTIIKELESQMEQAKAKEAAAVNEPAQEKTETPVEPPTADEENDANNVLPAGESPSDVGAKEAVLDDVSPSLVGDGQDEIPLYDDNVKKRPAEDAETDEPPKELDSLKEKLIAKKRRSKKKKT